MTDAAPAEPADRDERPVADPAAVEPAPVEPAPVEPAPVAPAPIGPASFRFDLSGALTRLAPDRAAPAAGDAAPPPADTGGSRPATEPSTPRPLVEPARPSAPVVSPAIGSPSTSHREPIRTDALRVRRPLGAAVPPNFPPSPSSSPLGPSPTDARSAVEPRSPSDRASAPPAATAPAPPEDPPQPAAPLTRSDRHAHGTSVFAPDGSTPGAPAVAPPAGDGHDLPRLPPSVALPSPSLATSSDQRQSMPDLVALHSAQVRARRSRHGGKLVGRSALVLFLTGLLVGATLLFGRPYLFPVSWEPALTPIVDEIQLSTGIEFDHTVPLVVLPPDEYGDRLLEATIGTAWVAQVPSWRALGIAGGEVNAVAVGAVMAQWRPAFFDPVTDTIYRSADADGDDLRSAVELALGAALQHQLRGSAGEPAVAPEPSALTGFTSPAGLARRAAETHLAARLVANRPTIVTDGPVGGLDDLPLPIAYELAATDRLGAPVLGAFGVPVDEPGAAVPEGIDAILDDTPRAATPAPLEPEEQPLGEAFALGLDDWSLVWGSRLPAASTSRLAGLVSAELYQAVQRGRSHCFVATFDTRSVIGAAEALTLLEAWALRAPESSAAAATLVAPTQVRLAACDPGADAVVTPAASSVDRLIDRQIARLAN